MELCNQLYSFVCSSVLSGKNIDMDIMPKSFIQNLPYVPWLQVPLISYIFACFFFLKYHLNWS